MSNSQILVTWRYYAYDEGHQHWCDDYASFATVAEAEEHIADIEQRIADGDHDVQPAVIVTEEDLPSYGRRSRRNVVPTF